MGFATVGASVVIFAAALFVGAQLAGAVFEAQRTTGRADEERHDRRLFAEETDVDVQSGDWQGNRLDLYFDNNGSTGLDVSLVQILLDGVWSTDAVTAKDVDGDNTQTMWPPGSTLHVRLQGVAQPQRAWFVVETGQGVVWTN